MFGSGLHGLGSGPHLLIHQLGGGGDVPHFFLNPSSFFNIPLRWSAVQGRIQCLGAQIWCGASFHNGSQSSGDYRAVLLGAPPLWRALSSSS